MVPYQDTIDDKLIFTVTQLNRAARTLMEQNFQGIWLRGELSGITIPSSGHMYFTLKDNNAQIKCALFKGNNKLNFVPQHGMEVLVRASASIYEPRGDYQLIVSHMEKWGIGQLQQAYEALKAKLQELGLFDTKRKRSFPTYPRHIGVITSHTGAAIQDILSVLKRRYPIAPVSIYHTLVQGKTAAIDIKKAIELANSDGKADVLIVARGGGSLEDLWCFNEEMVAWAIFESQIPVITGIGHEVDFTIADFVADYRAPTPSVAAETITPDTLALIDLFEQKLHRLQIAMQRRLQNAAMKVDSLEKQLVHPRMRLQKGLMQCEHLRKRLQWLMQQRVQKAQEQLSIASVRLNSISPLATLGRGYAIVSSPDTHAIISDVGQLKIGQTVRTQIARGNFESVVTHTHPK